MKCVHCKTDLHRLEVFPGELCMNCYAQLLPVSQNMSGAELLKAFRAAVR